MKSNKHGLDDLQEWADDLMEMEPSGFEGLGHPLNRYANSWRQETQDLRDKLRTALYRIRLLETELAAARAALREIDNTTVPSGFLRVWRERHASTIKAAREVK